MSDTKDLEHSKSESSDFGARGNSNGNAFMPTLEQVRTQGTISISPEMYESMYLAPKGNVKGDLRKRLGNPTPIGLAGFLIAYSPLTFSILGWRGTGQMGAATVGAYFFSGGVVAEIAMILEFILGNSFPATFFGVFGAYFLSYGATLVPSFNAYAAYDPTSPEQGAMAPAFLSGLAFWNLMMGFFTLFCTVCALRTNAMFFLAFFFLTGDFALTAASEWQIAGGNAEFGQTLKITGGALGFVTLVIGWYLLFALMLSTVDFPYNLPVGDLSTVIKGGSDLRKEKAAKADLERNA